MALVNPSTRRSTSAGDFGISSSVTRFAHLSVASNLDELGGGSFGNEEGNVNREVYHQRRESEASSSFCPTSMNYLSQTVFLCETRHDFEACVIRGPAEQGVVSRWRPKDRMKTGCVALVLCLNISVDPPDVIKISPCARMECWIDPFSMQPSKALESIGKALHAQYERWQPRAKYKLQLDPTVDEVKKLCTTCRKHAKSERVVFHYNGHGVPMPTANGEIWVFNKSYTQYIPLSINELDSWLRTPSLYVFDCSAAGVIVDAFMKRTDSTSSGQSDCILLAACEAHETLPQSAEFPADVFTSCLTTPIKMALRWFCKRSLLRDLLSEELIDRIPGRQTDRKTLLGELNWIFTAVTDTIAWNVLPHDLFQKLFRQDLLVASLFRNFLLAERIMRSANCSPISVPSLPPTHQHHMWDAWDMAAEICLSQLLQNSSDPNTEFQPSPFFTEQLTAFEVWLEHGSEDKKPPEQLPIVLQVLLSQSHRFRALVLLGRFLDMGPWAVDHALSVGIFPYVLKLLQTTAIEVRQILVFIWTKILALDKSCQVDLVKDLGHMYFIKFLDSNDAYPEQRAMAAFVLAVIVDGHRHGQEACAQTHLIQVCLRHLQLANPLDGQMEPLLLQWLCLCLGKLWEDFPAAQLLALQEEAPAILAPLLTEPQPEVRASAVFALGTLLDIGYDSLRDGLGGQDDSDDDEKRRIELNIVQALLKVVTDGSPLVRAEVAVGLSRFAFGHNKHLKSIAAAYWKTHSNSLMSSLSLATVKSPRGGYSSTAQFMQSSGIVSAPISPVTRVGDNNGPARDGRSAASSPLASSGIMHGSPSSDTSSQHSDSGIALTGISSNGAVNYSKTKVVDNSVYSQCVQALYTLVKDPSPRVASLGRQILSMVGPEQVTANILRPSAGGIRHGDVATLAQTPSLSGLARSSSWFDMNAGHMQMTFRTPPVSPPRQNYLSGMRRVCSLEFRPNQLSPVDSGLADSILGAPGSSERGLLPQSHIYSWSSAHFSRPLLTSADENDDLLDRREEREKFALDRIAKCQHLPIGRFGNQIANWDIRSEMVTKAMLLQPFSPVLVTADEGEILRIWNHEEGMLLNTFDNHTFLDKGLSKLCFVNELDDSLLLVASCDGSIRIWKDYVYNGKQKLVTAFSSIQGHRPGARRVNAVVDWQQAAGYLYASGEISSVMLWDLDKEQLLSSMPSGSDSSISAMSASQVQVRQLVAGYMDGSVRLFDVRAPEGSVCEMKPHIQRVERVIGVDFQPGGDSTKIVSASQAGDIQFMDIRKPDKTYLTIDAHRGSLTALAVHRHAPIIASGSSKQMIKVFSLEGEQLSVLRYYPSFMGQRIAPVTSLCFNPYRVLLAASTGGPADGCISIYADESSPAR